MKSVVKITFWRLIAELCIPSYFLIIGFGTSARSVMVAELCRVTEVKERSPILAACNGAGQVGIFIGPAFQLLFGYCHFSVFGLFEIHPLNAAGAFMGVVWLMLFFAALGMYYNLTVELEEIQKSDVKDSNVRNGLSVSVSQSMRHVSVVNKERATFNGYVNGTQRRFPIRDI